MTYGYKKTVSRSFIHFKTYLLRPLQVQGVYNLVGWRQVNIITGAIITLIRSVIEA